MKVFGNWSESMFWSLKIVCDGYNGEEKIYFWEYEFDEVNSDFVNYGIYFVFEFVVVLFFYIIFI